MSNGMTIPAWFLKVVAGCAALLTVGGVPWATWVTYTLIGISSHGDAVNGLETRVAAHEASIQVLIAGRVAANESLTEIKTDVRAMRSQVTDLQRQVDRAIAARDGGAE